MEESSGGLEKEDTKLKEAAFRLLGGNTVAGSGFEIWYIILHKQLLFTPRSSLFQGESSWKLTGFRQRAQSMNHENGKHTRIYAVSVLDS